LDDDCDDDLDDDPCDDGDACTLPGVCIGDQGSKDCQAQPVDCDDGLDCTDDDCDGGACANDIQAGKCVVDQVCYDDQESPIANPCVFCDADAAEVWTPVSDGQPCETVNTCVAGACVSAACDDGFFNGDETDLDCGGSCDPCDAGSACGQVSDCETAVCTGDVCQVATCTDLIANGDETDVDCGGSCSNDPDGLCPDGGGCAQAQDCESGVCGGTFACAVPTCTDGVKNGAETDVDCGGSCPVCLSGDACTQDSDCLTGACDDAEKTCLSIGELSCVSWGAVDLIFQVYGCTGCHGGSGSLSLTSYAGVLAGGNNPPAVVAEDADSSNLYLKLLDPEPFGDRMPQNGPPYLTPEELLVVKAWINLGANEVCP